MRGNNSGRRRGNEYNRPEPSDVPGFGRVAGIDDPVPRAEYGDDRETVREHARNEAEVAREERYTVVLEGTGEGNIDAGVRFCLPAVTRVEFDIAPNGDAVFEFENPKGDDMVENPRFVIVAEVRPGFDPDGLPQYHPHGPTDDRERRALDEDGESQ